MWTHTHPTGNSFMVSTGKADASCWVRQKDGSYIYLDENGQILKNHMTPDGFYVGPDGNGQHRSVCV